MKNYRFTKTTDVFVDRGTDNSVYSFEEGEVINVVSKMDDIFDEKIQYWVTGRNAYLTITSEILACLVEEEELPL
jgi:hypothetical protein